MQFALEYVSELEARASEIVALGGAGAVPTGQAEDR
jgi:hypothetical protein